MYSIRDRGWSLLMEVMENKRSKARFDGREVKTMKKRIFCAIVLLFVFGVLLAFGCKKDPTPNEEPPKENLQKEAIAIKGVIGDKVTINPIFEWEDPQNDSKFTLSLKDAEGASVATEETSSTHFELANELQPNKKYTLEIVGLESNKTYSTEFETISATTTGLKNASILVSEPYMSHMVLQREKPISLKGSTIANVLVSIDFYGQKKYAVTDENGEFSFSFDAMEANTTPTSIEIKILKDKKLVIEDVLVGDVFLVSGQSNVQRGVKNSDCTEADVSNAATYDVRYFYQQENIANAPSDSTVGGFWDKVNKSSEAYQNYSAVAFMVGSMLGKELSESNVPVGIIYAAKGDTNIVNWMSSDYYDGSIGTKNKHYNGMIYPIRNTEIKGVVWYQGCNNAGKGSDYEAHLKNLLANWRELFRNETLPFYIVQLPVYGGDNGNNYDFSYVRESQYKVCQADEKAYLIATCDGGDPNDIHPTQKRYICERLTKSILSTLYGANYLPQGPTYLSHEVQGSSAIITVSNGDGLTSNDSAIVGFELAGADGKYFDATATITEGKIVVSSESVANPVYIRYGFSKCPFLNIYNKDGFLMSPFRTDDHNHNIDLLDYRQDAVYSSNPSGLEISHDVVIEDGEIGLQITKPASTSSKDYGILQLSKWGAIGYKENGFKITVKGSASGAKLQFRIVEGSGETWAISMDDNYSVKGSQTIPLSAFTCTLNEGDGVLDLQAVMRVELVIKKTGEDPVTVTVFDAKFVDIERTKPADFTIKEAKNDGHECIVKYTFSTFVNNYRVLVSADSTNFSNPIFDETTTQTKVSFSPTLCEAGTDYYVKVIAINEIGETIAKSSGMLMNTVDRYSIADFEFASNEEFETYKTNTLAYKSVLTPTIVDGKMKINVKENGDSWAHFILKTTPGANDGFDALKFYMDLTEYKGYQLTIQLQDQYGSISFSYKVNFSAQKEGYFTIPLSSFTNQTYGAFPGGDVGRIAFNFSDGVGGASDNIYIDDIEYIKQ